MLARRLFYHSTVRNNSQLGPTQLSGATSARKLSLRECLSTSYSSGTQQVILINDVVKKLRLRKILVNFQALYSWLRGLHYRHRYHQWFQSSITLELSLANAINWKNIVQAHSEHSTLLPIILIQNKLDLIEDVELQNYQTQRFIEKFAQNNGFTRQF